MQIDESKVNVSVEFAPGEKEKTLVVRYDEPAKNYDPEVVTLDGVIITPSEFVTKRGDLVNPDKSHVIFNRKQHEITLVVDADSRFKTTVKGKMELNPFLKSLHLNDPKNPFSMAGLTELIQFAKIHFKDRTKHKPLMYSLKNYKATVEKTVEEWNDRDKGEKGSKVNKKLIEATEAVSLDFVLSVPIFVGGNKKIDIPVTVAKEPGETNVQLFLEYDEWEEVVENEIDEVFKDQMEFFQQFVIIEKS